MSIITSFFNGLYWLWMVGYTMTAAFLGLFFRPSRKSIVGELALITGAGHGIGRELALELSKFGAVVVLVDINQENNEKVGQEIRSLGRKAYTYTCDITNATKVYELAKQVKKDVGDVTILVNNAGILNGGKLLDLSEKAIRQTFEVNTLAHFWTVKAFLPAMMEKCQGHIFTTVSMAAFQPTGMLVDYSASKFGAWGFCESLKEELYEQGYPQIRLSTLCPYFVNTGLIKNFKDNLNKTLSAKEVAEIGVDGMLRNEELIFAPRHMWFGMKLLQTLPRATVKFMYHFIGNEIFPQYVKQD